MGIEPHPPASKLKKENIKKENIKTDSLLGAG
jgi:hypothetical protein